MSKMTAMKGKAKAHKTKGKVRSFHVRPMKNAKGEMGFSASVDRERMPMSMGMDGSDEDEARFHPHLNSVKKHMAEAFGAPDAGEPKGGDPGSKAAMTPKVADTDADGE